MTRLLLFLVTLTHQGYWTGGRENAVTVTPVVVGAAEAAGPRPSFAWELALDGTRLASGSVPLDEAAAAPARVDITVPAVRARTTLRLVYVIAAGGVTLQRGEQPIHVFPAPAAPAAGDAAPLAGKRMCLWEPKPPADAAAAGEPPLRAALRARGVTFQVVTDAARLALLAPDAVIVAPGALSAGAFSRDPLVELARDGAGVLVLEQRAAREAGGYELAARDAPSHVAWRGGHPLLGRLAAADVEALVSAAARPVAVRLPPNEAALELVYWPAEASGARPPPIDCLVATRTVGAGRLVYCQLPWAAWDDDPRAAVFLSNALAYLATRPEPTPPPADRHAPPQTAPAAEPPNRVPFGG